MLYYAFRDIIILKCYSNVKYYNFIMFITYFKMIVLIKVYDIS